MPTFDLQINFDDKGAVVAINRLNDVAGAPDKAGKAGARAGDDISAAMERATKKILGMVGAYAALEKAMGFFKARRRSQLQPGTKPDRYRRKGACRRGANKYAAARGMAAELMAKIQKLGLETTATSQELAEGVQSIMGPALQAGMAPKDIPDFAVQGAQAAQTLGIPLNQIRAEPEAPLSGSVNKAQDVLAPNYFRT